MAVSYGPLQNHALVWFDYSYGAVTPATTHVYVSVNAYLMMDSSSSLALNCTKAWSGTWGSGSAVQNINLGPNQSVLIVTWGASIALTDAPQSLGFAASVTHYFGTTLGELYFSIPARFALAPTGLTVSRVTDAQQTLAWTRGSTYTSVVVHRKTDGGVWQEIARPAGNVASFTDTTTTEGHKYEYRVAGVGGSGQSGWSNEATVYTSPAAPTAVEATRTAGGIQVSAGSLPAYATSFDVLDNDIVVGSAVSMPWLHASPNPAVPHTYKVRGRVAGIEGALSAPSNTVQLIAKPNPPTNLDPNGGVAAVESSVRLSWKHSPVDTTTQTVYELRVRPVSGAWTTYSGTTADFREVTLALGNFEWQARTKGQHADWSDWSALATVTVANRPGVAVVSPTTPWPQAFLDVEWSWFQAQGRPQSAWQVALFNEFDAQIDTASGTGATSSVRLTARVDNDTDYVVRVRAATGGMWSEWAEQYFTVSYLPPAEPVLTGVWNETSGSTSLSLADGVEEDTQPTIRVTLERSIDGEVWEPVAAFQADQLPVNLADWQSLSYGTTFYRAIAFTADQASAVTAVAVLAESPALWLSGGPSYGQCVRLPFNPQVTVESGRARTLKRYAGRELPVAYSGDSVSRTLAVAGTTSDEPLGGEITAAVSALDRISTLREPTHLFRDPDGRRVYGVISPIQMPRETVADGTLRPWNGVWGYSFSMTDTGR